MMRDRDGAIIKFNSLSMTYPSRRNFKSSKVFEDIKAALENRGESLVKKIKGVFAFKVAVPDGRIGLWIVDVKNGSGNVEFEGTAKPDVTLNISDSDMVALMEGTLNAQKAFFQGKLKVQGNMGLALKLQLLQKEIKAPNKTTSKSKI